jgi:ADP-ribose pyrophosphatase YjhB (NUDIX family)
MTLPMSEVVAVAVYEHGSRGRVMAVRRPEQEGEAFGGMWGLPAATVGAGETVEEAVRRLGRQKLGMTLEAVRELGRGTQAREDEELSMVLYEARAAEKEPRLVSNGDEDVTYYTDWKWADAEVFVPTAEAGSLCCQLFLDAEVAG